MVIHFWMYLINIFVKWTYNTRVCVCEWEQKNVKTDDDDDDDSVSL